MSSTRRATDDKFHQERFSSIPELSGDAINGFLAAKRIRLVRDEGVREVLWWIQLISLEPGGVQKICEELEKTFHDRFGTPTFRKWRKLGNNDVNALGLRQYLRLREEFGFEKWDKDNMPICSRQYEVEYFESELKSKAEDLPEILTRFCVDPAADITKGVWFFEDLLGALQTLRQRFIDSARSRLANTVVSQQMLNEFDYFYNQRQNISILGKSGIGRTVTTRAACDMHAGMIRYVETPSSNDDRSFYVAVARALGVARGAAFNTQQIKLKIEETLNVSGLMLAIDECQYLWPQTMSPRGIPSRMLWIKSVSDAGTPMALIGLDIFSRWQELYVKKTLWPDEQFERRFPRRLLLPAQHPKEDFLKIARVLFPEGDLRSWKMLAGLAYIPLVRGTEKRPRFVNRTASAMEEAANRARYCAKRAARKGATFNDIRAAVNDQLGAIAEKAEQSHGQGACCSDVAEALKDACKCSAKRVAPPARKISTPQLGWRSEQF
jgi:hypothetical protein